MDVGMDAVVDVDVDVVVVGWGGNGRCCGDVREGRGEGTTGADKTVFSSSTIVYE